MTKFSLGIVSLTTWARKLRLAVVKNMYDQDLITKEQAQEILNGRLSPDDPDSVYEDGWLLDELDALEILDRGETR